MAVQSNAWTSDSFGLLTDNLKYGIIIFRPTGRIVSWKDDRGCLRGIRGKSELLRAGCWIIPSEGDLRESATEMQTAG